MDNVIGRFSGCPILDHKMGMFYIKKLLGEAEEFFRIRRRNVKARLFANYRNRVLAISRNKRECDLLRPVWLEPI